MNLTIIAKPAPAQPKEITIDGSISLGSSQGLIFDAKQDYAYAGTTRHLDILMRGCPIHMGEIVPCVVKFLAEGRSATEIQSATAPSFRGIAINKPGSVYDASVCDQKANVDYAVRPGCIHVNELMVEVLATDGPLSQVRWNGQIKYALSQRVLINCQGTSVTLASYLGKNFPPGMKTC